MAERRQALKIIGAVGSTCAFPFAADELYGQHEHAAGPAAATPAPRFFTAEELETVTRLADLIIPATGTPGAAAAGVPAYIDMVVDRNAEARQLYRAGLAWLDQQAKAKGAARFVAMDEAAQIALLTPLCRAADRLPRPGTLKAKAKPKLEVAFFRAVKSMTADGYYTSETGLTKELGYAGNTVLGQFPECLHEH